MELGENIFTPPRMVVEMRRYREMARSAYVAERQREAMAFIREDYGRFMVLNMKRFIYYWGGVPPIVGDSALARSEFCISRVFGACFWG